jgi:hypothetical protein
MTNRHADIKRQYCEIWIDDPEPWKRVQVAAFDTPWLNCTMHPDFSNEHLRFRIIPEQITIAGITFDAPLREEPMFGTVIYSPASYNSNLYEKREWFGEKYQVRELKAGGYFSTAEAAAACARAFSKLVGGEV